MKNDPVFFDYNGKHVSAIFKSGSSAIGRAIHYALQPDYKVISASGNQTMVDRVMHNPGWQAMVPKTRNPVSPAIPVRDPMERFRSACAQEGRTADEALDRLEAGNISGHFRPVQDYLVTDSLLFRFPEHLDDLAEFLGLDSIPEVNTSNLNNGPKPDLTPEQLAHVEAFYADDIALFNSITEPGTINSSPIPEPEPIHVPVPTSVPRYEFLGQLAKEVQTGEDEQLKQALASMGDNIKTLLHHMIAQADMPEQARAQAHNEIDEARTFLRAHPFIDQIGPAFGYVTDEQKDQFTRRAAVYKFGA